MNASLKKKESTHFNFDYRDVFLDFWQTNALLPQELIAFPNLRPTFSDPNSRSKLKIVSSFLKLEISPKRIWML